MFSSVALLLIGASLAAAQVVRDRPCDPNMTAVQLTDASGLFKTWHQQFRYPQTFEAGSSCNTATYSGNDDGSVRILNSLKREDGSIYALNGRGVFSESPSVAKFTVRLDTVPADAPLWVVAADSGFNWGVFWGCRDMGNGTSAESAFGMTKELFPDVSVIEEMLDASTSKNIDIMDYILADQFFNC